MLIYKHNLLFDKQEATVQKTYRIPKRLEGYISDFAQQHDFTNTDIVIEALLHYFSCQIASELTAKLEQKSTPSNAAREDHSLADPKASNKEQRRLELLCAEFCEYFIDSLEQRLTTMRGYEKQGQTLQPQKIIDQRDAEIATLKLLLEKFNQA